MSSACLAFNKIFCVSLARREDKWQAFKARCPWSNVEKFVAVDGQLCKPPSWWKQGAPAWGCYKSHVRIVEECLNDGVESVLIFEDDAVFMPEFEIRFEEFWSHIPENWDMVYLGGQLITAEDRPPERVNDRVFIPDNVNRTHAYALSGKFLKTIYQHLHKTDDWKNRHHVDHHYGRLHQSRKHNVYIPSEWLVGQGEGFSDIKAKSFDERFWPSASQVVPNKRPFVFVVGLHGSGSSCLATCMHKAGVHMGNAFAYRPDSGEALSIARILEEHMPFPTTTISKPAKLQNKLLKWANMKSKEHKLAGMKYPHLCATANLVVDAFDAKIVHIDRPLEDSIKSLQQREAKRDPESIATLQRFLHDEKRKLLDAREHLTVDYYSLLANPLDELTRVVNFVGLKPSSQSMREAVAHVDATRRHV